MKVGDRVKLKDGRRGKVVAAHVPIAAWTTANGKLGMKREERNREFEVEVENFEGSASRIFVTDRDTGAAWIIFAWLAAGLALGAAGFFAWLIWG